MFFGKNDLRLGGGGGLFLSDKWTFSCYLEPWRRQIPSRLFQIIRLLTSFSNNSVRSRDGRRNRAPPPRVRYNKDGKKLNPQQAAAVKTA
jgi:hypothetical protein